MVLNGDINEYHDMGPVLNGEDLQGGIDHAAIELLINFLEFAWTQWSYTSVMRLNGGGSKKRRFWERMESMSTSVEKKYAEMRRLGISSVKKLRSGIDYIRSGNDFFRNLGVEYSPGVEQGLGAAASTLEQLQNMFEASPARVFPPIDSFRIGPMTVPTAGLPWRNESSVIPYLGTGTYVNVPNIEMPLDRGAQTLALKNSLTKRLRTHCYYYMLPLLWTRVVTSSPNNLLNHKTEQGTGPHLYMTYNRTTTALKREPNFNTPQDWDQGMEEPAGQDENRGIGWKNIVYVFAADWPFLTMNHDLKTQDSTTGDKGNYLSWKYVDYSTTTENNPPLQLANFITNKDWQYITHYQTTYTFDLMNTSLNTYIVEIMFFKFKADPAAMSYFQQVTAVSRRQKNKVQQWMYNINEIPTDISIVHRKRIMLAPENQTNYWKAANVNTGFAGVTNTGTYKFNLKRQYVLKRPILGTYDNLSENQMFNTYYEPDKGVYCRIQAFTLDTLRSTSSSDFANVWYGDEDTLNNPTSAKDGTDSNGKGVSCKIEKTSYFKLDENMYKTYAKA